VAVVLLFFLVALVVVVVALLIMAVGGTLASVGACLLLRDAVSGGRAPDPFGLTLLVGGTAAFVTPVLVGVGLYLAG
jgi:hypothetical protein